MREPARHIANKVVRRVLANSLKSVDRFAWTRFLYIYFFEQQCGTYMYSDVIKDCDVYKYRGLGNSLITTYIIRLSGL